jgi:hypothetical protein
MSIHFTRVVFLVVTAAHTLSLKLDAGSNKIFIGMPIIALSLPFLNTMSARYLATISSVFCARTLRN